jgi:hypothetical protein
LATREDISIRQGDTYSRPLTITEGGVAVNITGAALTFALRAYMGSVVLTSALALTTPAAGIATLTLSAAQTAALTAQRVYRYEVECVDASSNVTTPVEGLACVTEDVG